MIVERRQTPKNIKNWRSLRKMTSYQTLRNVDIPIFLRVFIFNIKKKD